jgi:putative NIF3 family GTP cyclohydrolase 1 type 2
MTTTEKNNFSRRKFLKTGSYAVAGAPVIMTGYMGTDHSQNKTISCLDIADHFRATDTGKQINWSRTTDTFKAGDPSKPVRKVAVAWKATWDALKEAVSREADMFISHESICVNAQNGSPEPDVVFAMPSEKPKFEWLDKTKLVVYRCHDVWDRFPGTGIRDTWQRELKLGGKIIADDYPFYVTEVSPMTLGDLARHILERIKPLGQNGIMVTGDLKTKISRIGTGTGQSNDPVRLQKTGADVGILVDDGYLHVRMGVHARELHFPVIQVNHGVSEEWGIRNLALYVQQAFPSLEVFHIPQYCPYRMIVS